MNSIINAILSIKSLPFLNKSGLFNLLALQGAYRCCDLLILADKTKEEHDDSYDKQYVDESADCISSDDSEEPEYDEDDSDCF